MDVAKAKQQYNNIFFFFKQKKNCEKSCVNKIKYFANLENNDDT